MVWTPLKNISHLGWLFPIYGKIKNVPNHQPVLLYLDFPWNDGGKWLRIWWQKMEVSVSSWGYPQKNHPLIDGIFSMVFSIFLPSTMGYPHEHGNLNPFIWRQVNLHMDLCICIYIYIYTWRLIIVDHDFDDWCLKKNVKNGDLCPAPQNSKRTAHCATSLRVRVVFFCIEKIGLSYGRSNRSFQR